jgi:hypothetical protein
MFISPNVQCFIHGITAKCDDPHSKELKLNIHISPIAYELAKEISPAIADRLFRFEKGDGPDPGGWVPARELTKANFSGITVPMQNLKFAATPESTGLVFVPGAAISNLRACKATAESFDFRFEFDVLIPMDRTTLIDVVDKFFGVYCFITMEEIQQKIDLDVKDEAQAEQHDLLQEAADGEASDAASAAAGDGKGRRGRPKKPLVN